MAPRAKSDWPPLDDQYRPATVSDAHWHRDDSGIVDVVHGQELDNNQVDLGRGVDGD